jgi:hypothetical protein
MFKKIIIKLILKLFLSSLSQVKTYIKKGGGGGEGKIKGVKNFSNFPI